MQTELDPAGWYWHDSSDEDYSDSDEELAGAIQGEEELTESGSQSPTVEPAVLGWDAEGEAKLRGIWDKGSRSTEERKQRNAREFQRQAAQYFHIGGMFKKAQEKADRRETEVQATGGQENGQEKRDLDNPA